uniref:Keratin-associated protein n=1 Tax=Ursus americanus TaxID=9643 RepID=A0A452QL94_URSAM
MSYSCCSGNFSSRSLGGYLRYPGSSCCSYPSNLVYQTPHSHQHYCLSLNHLLGESGILL